MLSDSKMDTSNCKMDTSSCTSSDIEMKVVELTTLSQDELKMLKKKQDHVKASRRYVLKNKEKICEYNTNCIAQITDLLFIRKI